MGDLDQGIRHFLIIFENVQEAPMKGCFSTLIALAKTQQNQPDIPRFKDAVAIQIIFGLSPAEQSQAKIGGFNKAVLIQVLGAKYGALFHNVCAISIARLATTMPARRPGKSSKPG